MECDRICIYRIYRNFGIVIEQRDDQFSIEQFPRTRAYTHSHIHYSFTVVTNIYTLIWKNKNFDISNIFHNLRGNTVFFSFFFYIWFFPWIVSLAIHYTFDLITIIEILSRVTFDFAIQHPCDATSISLGFTFIASLELFPSWMVGDKSTRGEGKINQTNSDEKFPNNEEWTHFNSFITTTVNPVSHIVFSFRIQRFSVISSHVCFYTNIARGR